MKQKDSSSGLGCEAHISTNIRFHFVFDRTDHKRRWNKKRSGFHKTLIARWKKRKGCCECGYNLHHAGLVLDHKDPLTKDRNKRSLSFNPLWKKDRIKLELSKCQVLCATCHNVRSYQSQHYNFRSSGDETGSTGDEGSVEIAGKERPPISPSL